MGQIDRMDVMRRIKRKECEACGHAWQASDYGTCPNVTWNPGVHRFVEVEYVRADDLEGAVEAEREALRMILKADRGDWDRTIPTLAQWAEARLREIGGQ